MNNYGGGGGLSKQYRLRCTFLLGLGEGNYNPAITDLTGMVQEKLQRLKIIFFPFEIVGVPALDTLLVVMGVSNLCVRHLLMLDTSNDPSEIMTYAGL